jgi:hypothetical protein
MNQEWHPHPGPQTEALRRNEFEILYGGARGGGKTDAGLVWLTDHIDNPRYRALVIRRNADDLSDWIDRAGRMYHSLGVKIAYRPAILTFPSGAIIKTGHLKDEQAYTKYQGHEYHRLLVEELTQIPSEKRYMQLLSSCRSTIPELEPHVFLTTNPGGVGHGWVKRRFVDPSPPGVPFLDDNGRDRIFIPARVDDNPTLMKNDPNYVKTLEAFKTTDEMTYKAWRLGSWDVFLGQVFMEWVYDKHVSDRFLHSLDECKKIICFDWGYNDPGSALWLAIAPENKYGVSHVYCYRELHVNHKTPEQWADMISVFTKIEDTEFMVLPHDCFVSEGKRSIADIFKASIDTRIIRGDTLSRGARLNRLASTHQFLSDSTDGRPYLIIHPKCENLIRTLPELVYDEVNVEDVDSSGDDHDYDALSLGLMTIQLKYKLNSGRVRSSRKVSQTVFSPVNKQGDFQGPDFLERIKENASKHHKGWEER